MDRVELNNEVSFREIISCSEYLYSSLKDRLSGIDLNPVYNRAAFEVTEFDNEKMTLTRLNMTTFHGKS